MATVAFLSARVVEGEKVVVVRGLDEVVVELSFDEVCLAAEALREYAESITPAVVPPFPSPPESDDPP